MKAVLNNSKKPQLIDGIYAMPVITHHCPGCSKYG
jgi:hypothetical protein